MSRRSATVIALSSLIVSLAFVGTTSPAAAHDVVAKDVVALDAGTTASTVQPLATFRWPASGSVERTCSTWQTCRVRATGGKGWQYHYKNGSAVAKWNSATTVTRTSLHGSGKQTAHIVTHTTLMSPSATCICTATDCNM